MSRGTSSPRRMAGNRGASETMRSAWRNPLSRRIPPIGTARAQLVALAERFERFREFAAQPKRLPEVAVDLGIVRVEADGCAVLCDRLVPLPLVEQNIAEPAVARWRSGLSRIAVRSSAMASSGLPCLQGVAEVGVGFGGIGLESDRGAVFGDGLLELAQVRVGGAEVAVGEGGIGLEPDRGAEFGDGLVELALLGQGGAEVVWARRSRA